MKTHLLLALAILTIDSTETVTNGIMSPDCAPKCWENSRLVSTCSSEAKCLCEDNGFQSAVFQCLYSQCQTAQFASALHFALSQCSSIEPDGSAVLPRLIRQKGLRKRIENDAVSGSTFMHPTASTGMIQSTVNRHASVSASAYFRPIRSTDSGGYALGARTTQAPASKYTSVPSHMHEKEASHTS